MFIHSAPGPELLPPGYAAHSTPRGALAPRATPARDDRPAENALQSLSGFAAQRGLEVRLRALPEGSGTIIQFVDPHRNEVVREFPSDDLVRVLKAIRARGGANLDQQA